MTPEEAKELIAGAIPRSSRRWADLGAGTGTFTRALSELLGPEARVYAVDRDRHALGAIEPDGTARTAQVVTVHADFTRHLALDDVGGEPLDGALMANALHFVEDQESVLRRVIALLRLAGRVVVVEYDRRAPSRWVPYPIPPERLGLLAARTGLRAPTVVKRRPSLYGGTLYAAYLTPGSGAPGQMRTEAVRQ